MLRVPQEPGEAPQEPGEAPQEPGEALQSGRLEVRGHQLRSLRH